MRDAPRHIVLTGNTGFKIANFRAGLIRALIAQGHRVTVVAPPDGYFDPLKAMGCAVVPITMDRNGTSPLAEARLAAQILVVLRRLRPDMVFSYTIKNNIYAGLACRLLGIPFAPNVTGLGPAFNRKGLLNRVVRGLYRQAFRRARAVFFQNTEDRAVFLQAGLVDPQVARLLPGSGADLQRFNARPLPPETRGIVFLFVARLLWDKGLGVLAEAARDLRISHPHARIHVLGPLDPDSASAISAAQMQDWIAEGLFHWLGSTEDVRPMLEAAHCVVLPSYYREGTPRSLIEACAIGRPILTTDMPGCRDVVIPGETGFLCAPRDAGSLATAMRAFLALDPAQRAAMGAAARRLAETRYDEAIVIAAYQDILSSPMMAGHHSMGDPR